MADAERSSLKTRRCFGKRKSEEALEDLPSLNDASIEARTDRTRIPARSSDELLLFVASVVLLEADVGIGVGRG